MSILSEKPAVFAVRNDYWICVLANAECTMCAEVGGVVHWDHSNGTLRSRRVLKPGTWLHMARVPQAELDSARSYTVRLRRIVERKPYWTKCGETESATFGFRPVRQGPEINIVNLADAHSLVDEPVAAGRHFGDGLDLLVLNGDIPNHSGDTEFFEAIYQTAGRITEGGRACVFVRGNHDMRGPCAEFLADCVPTDRGASYFEFRAGPIWGLVLDTAEDKADDHPEYGHTICGHAFRVEEDAFIDETLAAGRWKDARLRLVACHKPLALEIPGEFAIEADLYRSWCAKTKAIKPHLLLSGHLHKCFVEAPGGAHDTYGQPCLHVCSSLVSTKEPRSFTCGAISVALPPTGGDPAVRVDFVDDDGTVHHAYDGHL